LLDNNTKDLKVVFKHFPLRNHKFAKPAAVASLAAHEQGKFWEFHDKLFRNQKTLTNSKFIEIAAELQLDVDKFKKDLTKLSLKRAVTKDFSDGQAAGVRGTPAMYINGRRIKSRSISAIQKMIDNELDRL
jgi:protein-disulfide isomerase